MFVISPSKRDTMQGGESPGSAKQEEPIEESPGSATPIESAQQEE